MADAREVSAHPLRRRALWCSAALGAAGAGLTGVGAVDGGGLLDVRVVRLAAAPADLTRILQELEAGRGTAPAVEPGPSV